MEARPGRILEAVNGREQALRDAIAAAERDRAEAAHGEMLEQMRTQQAELLDRAIV